MPVRKDLLLVLKSDAFGVDEPDLGAKLICAYLGQLLSSGEIPARIHCLGSGVFLTTEGSPVLKEMRAFEEAGSVIASCGTCLEYYGRADALAVGTRGNMAEHVQAEISFGRVIRP